MVKLFENEKETKRAIKAAVDQYEIYRHYTSVLSTGGVERIELQTREPNCGEIAKAWREVNTTYHDSRNTDPKQQGNYTHEGKTHDWVYM